MGSSGDDIHHLSNTYTVTLRFSLTLLPCGPEFSRTNFSLRVKFCLPEQENDDLHIEKSFELTEILCLLPNKCSESSLSAFNTEVSKSFVHHTSTMRL